MTMTSEHTTTSQEEQTTMTLENFKLQVEPSEITFAGNLLDQVRTQITICNKSGTRQAFKIRCTSNEAFRIRPPIGILNERPVEVELLYRGGKNINPNTRHHFTIYHIPAPHGSSAEGAWKEHYGPAQGKRHFFVSFAHL